MPLSRVSLSLAFTVACLVSLPAEAHGKLGFSVSVDADGVFSPTLKHVKVDAVMADTPAQQAGLEAGDDIEAANDVTIAGALATRLKDRIDAVQPGDHLRLKVRRKDGEHLVDMVAGPDRSIRRRPLPVISSRRVGPIRVVRTSQWAPCGIECPETKNPPTKTSANHAGAKLRPRDRQ